MSRIGRAICFPFSPTLVSPSSSSSSFTSHHFLLSSFSSSHHSLSSSFCPAALLKLYFRELPDPVIPRESYDTVISLSRTLFHHRLEFEALKNTAEMADLVNIITELPKYSYNLLRFMCQFLNKATEYYAGKSLRAGESQGLDLVIHLYD